MKVKIKPVHPVSDSEVSLTIFPAYNEGDVILVDWEKRRFELSPVEPKDE